MYGDPPAEKRVGLLWRTGRGGIDLLVPQLAERDALGMEGFQKRLGKFSVSYGDAEIQSV